MLNQAIYDFAVWVDTQQWSTMLHESYYMYNWVETTHVLTLMISLGMLFLIDLRMLGLALPNVPASTIANKLNIPMLFGFSIMVITGLLLFYAIPVRSSQSVWFRNKVVLLIAAAKQVSEFPEIRGGQIASECPISARIRFVCWNR